MKKVLVSWVATNHDFLKKNPEGEMVHPDSLFNEDGPHFSLHRDFGEDYHTHYLLSQYDEETNTDVRWEQLARTLTNRFKTRVIVRYMGIDDIFSVGTIKNKVEQLIKFTLRDMDVEIFMNPGTSAMQIAWHLLGSELSTRNTILFFRRREKRFVKLGTVPPKEGVKFEVSEYARTTNVRDNYTQSNLVSEEDYHISDTLKEVYAKALQVAGNDRTTVLIKGAIGTGKSHLVRYIHQRSNRRAKTFKIINCAAHREEVMENLIFGFEPGAFEGAKKITTGIFERANGGTIVLEEVDQLPIRIQVQLLKILNNKAINRIGSDKDLPLDVRIITTTTKDLWELSTEGSFRMDLYHRLAIAELDLPLFTEMPPKERKVWIQYFMETTYTKLEKRYIKNVDKQVWKYLLDYPFLGNLKEVQNVVEVLYTFCEDCVTMDDIPRQMKKIKKDHPLLLDNVIKKHVRTVVEQCGGNISSAAEHLGRDRATVKKYLK